MQDIYTRQTRLLLRVLPHLEHTSPDGSALFALKGGTALNFFIQPLPRLSVDIDLTYCPLEERDTALAAIDRGLQALTELLQRRLPGLQCTYTGAAESSNLLVRHDGATIKVEPNRVIGRPAGACAVASVCAVEAAQRCPPDAAACQA